MNDAEMSATLAALRAAEPGVRFRPRKASSLGTGSRKSGWWIERHDGRQWRHVA